MVFSLTDTPNRYMKRIEDKKKAPSIETSEAVVTVQFKDKSAFRFTAYQTEMKMESKVIDITPFGVAGKMQTAGSVLATFTFKVNSRISLVDADGRAFELSDEELRSLERALDF